MKEVQMVLEQGDCWQDLYEAILDDYDKQIDVDDYVAYIIDALPEEKKALYKMYYVDRKSYREISSVLSISEPAVRMKFMRLKKDIKKIVKTYARMHFDVETRGRQKKSV